ncbi:MAG: rhomboid family intramembrane serine protease [Bacteroidales bacterium]|jgi:membrane associated rhomboid family serine protease|nr:rhomboid family intramembrane serine protease [Bacteroidales bacterium]OQC60867.1 MAG: Rhomboid family protein [Bacteroidetes bacterium ADurb.Bin012]MBP9512355.1 rhomboid family intramembrane serine protease [Bacteroidales bacterium]HOE58256.1 rhomboid family intramembrane serine protease [Bacteroidales bacterium]HOU34038.1 rhomboid family intramembrane serine protease [Bacteroidales bacterium]
MQMTIIIIAITTPISIMAFYRPKFMDMLKFNAFHIYEANEGWRFITYGLVHANWLHLIINMYVLYNFGLLVESYFGYFFGGKASYYYLMLYLGGLAISVVSAYQKNKGNIFYNAVGASGAISGIIFSAIIFNPFMSLRFIFIPISFPAILFGAAYLIYSWFMSKKGDSQIGHDAHFWGGVYGIVFTIVLKPALAINLFEQLTRIFQN